MVKTNSFNFSPPSLLLSSLPFAVIPRFELILGNGNKIKKSFAISF